MSLPLEHDSASAGPVPSLAAADLLRSPSAVVIDLRSPREFAEDHVVGALNVPLFDDLERAVVGTYYSKHSPEEAFAQGRAIVCAKIQGLAARIASIAGEELPPADLAARVLAMTEGGITVLERSVAAEPARELPARPIVLNCWRGGLRSRSVAALLRALGMRRVMVLQGGYRAWRAQIARALEGWESPPAFVLHGLTGVGKTLVLRELERIRPGWTVDLEALAGHRSSLLGMVGLQPVSQKMFESRLFERVRAGFAPFVVYEGESRKVGDIILPPALWRSLSSGTNLELTAGEARRLQVLKAEYLATDSNRAELGRQLPKIEARMQRKSDATPLCELLETGRVDELVSLLLERYYDPLYLHSQKEKSYAATFDACDPEHAAGAIAAWIEARITQPARGTSAALG